ncbi:fungal-specific transcription factor domain-containing protein [Biscogniauxia mediterranea]|nr:fungal-specific transcription factor domain-containing protein [Biscogniauxia mediterranea]
MDPSVVDNKPFSCPACPSRFTRQENLNRHTASVHRKSNRRPYPCPLCEVSFSRSDLRKRHVKKCHPQGGAEAAGLTTVPGTKTGETTLMPEPATIQTRPSSQPLSTGAVESQQQPNPRADTDSIQVSNLFSAQNISWLFRLPQFIAEYFERFHPSFPALHKPTFDVTVAREPLLQAVACIGAMYHSPACNNNISMALFEAGHKHLDAYIREDRSRFRETWVIQAYVLFEYFALYSCRDNLFPTAVRIHRKIVDAARQYQLFQDGVALGGCASVASPGQASTPGNRPVQPSSPSWSVEHDWQVFIKNESRKRIMYCLYYLDAQLSICCNMRPLLTALELKYELPCRDDIWSARTANAWHLLLQGQEFSFNEEDDYDANGEPRPAQGDLYESMMHLMNPDPSDRPLGLLWYSSFASLMLIIQIQMMTRELTLASIFLYNNVRGQETRHNLSIITEGNRAPIMQALNNLADLMPRPSSTAWSAVFNSDSSTSVHAALWHSVWMVWHYTAISLTHQDALLTSGIVEYSLPTAISTAWELGKPRAKEHRDVYEDRDVMRVVDNLEHIIQMLGTPPTGALLRDPTGTVSEEPCIEDPFATVLGFKACMMGWRVVRLMALGYEQQISTRSEVFQLSRPNLCSLSSQVILARVMEALGPETGDQAQFQHVNQGHLGIVSSAEARFLEWTERTFALRDIWPPGEWVVAVFNENREGAA